MGQSSPTSLKGKSAVADRSSYVHFQTVLDDGNVYNWFDSPFIVKLSAVAALALVGFVLWQFLTPTPLVNLRLLGRRNFGLGTLGNFLLGFALYGSAYLLPQYLSVAQGFDAEQIGEVMAWTGLPQLLVIPLVPLLMKRMGARRDRPRYLRDKLFYEPVARSGLRRCCTNRRSA
jgi:hypothetical protein